jgi:hypothetical protein
MDANSLSPKLSPNIEKLPQAKVLLTGVQYSMSILSQYVIQKLNMFCEASLENMIATKLKMNVQVLIFIKTSKEIHIALSMKILCISWIKLWPTNL